MPAQGWDREKAPLSLWPVAVPKGPGQEVPVCGKNNWWVSRVSNSTRASKVHFSLTQWVFPIWRLHYYDAIFINSPFFPLVIHFTGRRIFSLCQQKVTYIRDMATGPALRKFLSNALHSNHFHSWALITPKIHLHFHHYLFCRWIWVRTRALWAVSAKSRAAGGPAHLRAERPCAATCPQQLQRQPREQLWNQLSHQVKLSNLGLWISALALLGDGQCYKLLGPQHWRCSGWKTESII